MIVNILIIIKFIICIPFLFFIPGFLINSIFFHTKSLKFDSSILLQIFVSIIISSLIGLFLAQLGKFSLFSLITSLILISGLFYFKFRKLNEELNLDLRIVFNLENTILILLIFSSIFLFFQPFQYIGGGQDPGVYVSNGVHIAKTGSLFIKDPILAQMNTSIQEILYDVEPASVYGFISWENFNFKFQMPGFFITDLTSGTITPQFLHIFPVWIAIFYSIFGLPGIFYVNPVFALLSLAAVFLIGKRLFSWKVGVIACFLLAINFTQIWYARYPFAEMMTQFFIMSGLATFIHFNKNSNKYLAIISALLFGLAFLTKFDGIVLLIPFGLYYIYIYIYRKLTICHQYFAFTLVIMLIYTSIDYLVFTKPYFDLTLQLAIGSPPSFGGGNAGIYNKLLINITIFSWYLTKLGLLLAIIGIGIILIKRDNEDKLFIIFIALMFSTYYLLKLETTNPPPWWARRFVPAVVPLFSLFTSYALIEISKIRKIGIYITLLVLFFLIASLTSTSNIIVNHNEGEGLIKATSELSEYFNDNDIILMGPSIEGSLLSTPLYYIYDKKVIYLNKYVFFPKLYTRNLTSPEKISIGIDYLLDQGYNLYIFSSSNYMDNLLYNIVGKYKIDFIKTYDFSFRHLNPTTDNLLPYDVSNFPMKSNIYKVSRDKSNIYLNDNFSIDIGSPLDVTYLEKGFYNRENWGDNITFRWTSSNATIRIPTPKSNDLMISINAESWRPNNDIPPAKVIIYLNEFLIGNFKAHMGYETYNMSVKKSYLSSPYSTLRISSSTWNPSESPGNADTRDLGIKVNNITIEQSIQAQN